MGIATALSQPSCAINTFQHGVFTARGLLLSVEAYQALQCVHPRKKIQQAIMSTALCTQGEDSHPVLGSGRQRDTLQT